MSTLAGRRIVVTRAPHQAEELAALLRERAAEPLLYPCIDIAPPPNPAPLDEALRAAAEGHFGWLVLTSANTVIALRRRLESLALAPDTLTRLQLAAVGSSTARLAAEQLGMETRILPETYTADALARTLVFDRGDRVLLPQSAIADADLREALDDLGAQITAVEAYTTVLGTGGVDLPALLRAGQVDAVTLASASAAGNLVRRLEAEGGSAAALTGLCIAVIGPKTAAAALKHGLHVSTSPMEHTLDGLVTALENYFP